MRVTGLWTVILWAVLLCSMARAAEERPIDVIEDNSFLIEEAYNQEPGVVQHIFNAVYTTSGAQHGWLFNFTQEWPVFSQDHQFSYTIPSGHLIEEPDRIYGIGDMLLNYRYQALEEGEFKPAFAPRFSLILADRQPRSRHRQWRGRLSMGASFQQEARPAIRDERQSGRHLFARCTGAPGRQHGASFAASFAGFL